MKKIYMMVLLGLFIHPGFVCASDLVDDAPQAIEDFDDLVEDVVDNIPRWQAWAQTGGEFVLAGIVGTVAFMLVFATSITVRKKTIQAIKKVRSSVQRMMPLDRQKEAVLN